MILDNQTLFSDMQAITASAASTNLIDLGPIGTGIVLDVGAANPGPLFIQVTETFNNLTSLKVEIQTDDNAAFSSPATNVLSATIPLASLIAGYQIPIDFIPRGVKERYVRLYYTVTGTAPTTGKITAGVSLSMGQTNNG